MNINYRLGILGFMNHFNLETNSPQGGNYGLLDQQMALEFIYENAELIGGDLNRITIFGESAGGESGTFSIKIGLIERLIGLEAGLSASF